MTPLELFNNCLIGPFNTAGDDTQYKIISYKDFTLLVFPGSSSLIDWRDNFNFPIKPYKDQTEKWYAHGGFVRAWKKAEKQIAQDVYYANDNKPLVIAGYSHGADIAILAHEYFQYNFYDVITSTFAASRVLWLPSKSIQSRFGKLTNYQVRGDIATLVPPWLFGYRHVGKVAKLGPNRFPSHLPHYPARYYENLMGV